MDRGVADYKRASALADAHAIIPVLVALGFADAVIRIARGEFVEAQVAMLRCTSAGRQHDIAWGTGAPDSQTLRLRGNPGDDAVATALDVRAAAIARDLHMPT